MLNQYVWNMAKTRTWKCTTNNLPWKLFCPETDRSPSCKVPSLLPMVQLDNAGNLVRPPMETTAWLHSPYSQPIVVSTYFQALNYELCTHNIKYSHSATASEPPHKLKHELLDLDQSSWSVNVRRSSVWSVLSSSHRIRPKDLRSPNRQKNIRGAASNKSPACRWKQRRNFQGALEP